MKVLQLFAHFTDEQWALLREKYPSEQSLKILLGEKLIREIIIEVEQIKNDKALSALQEAVKL